jgi:5-methylcytosine-specific restriction endonuclease McrA
MAEFSQCWFCGKHLKFRARTVDHIEPYSWGGEKMVTACKECNNLKGDSSVEEFRQFIGVKQFYGEKRGWIPW